MVDSGPNKAEMACGVDELDGANGRESLAVVIRFAKQVIAVYRPHLGASDYARHKPLRTLLRSYRHYYRLEHEDCRHQLAANLRQVFQSPPNDVSVFAADMNEQVFVITDAFFGLLEDLYAGIPSLVARHENELMYAYDLAIDLVAPAARLEAQRSQAQAIVQRILAQRSKLLLSSEERQRLKEDSDRLQSLLKALEKGGEAAFAAQLRQALKV